MKPLIIKSSLDTKQERVAETPLIFEDEQDVLVSIIEIGEKEPGFHFGKVK